MSFQFCFFLVCFHHFAFLSFFVALFSDEYDLFVWLCCLLTFRMQWSKNIALFDSKDGGLYKHHISDVRLFIQLWSWWCQIGSPVVSQWLARANLPVDTRARYSLCWWTNQALFWHGLLSERWPICQVSCPETQLHQTSGSLKRQLFLCDIVDSQSRHTPKPNGYIRYVWIESHWKMPFTLNPSTRTSSQSHCNLMYQPIKFYSSAKEIWISLCGDWQTAASTAVHCRWHLSKASSDIQRTAHVQQHIQEQISRGQCQSSIWRAG